MTLPSVELISAGAAGLLAALLCEPIRRLVWRVRGPDVCEWTDDEDGVWHTGCGNAFVLDPYGTPAEHGMTYCPYCGREIRAVLFGEYSKNPAKQD